MKYDFFNAIIDVFNTAYQGEHEDAAASDHDNTDSDII